MKINKLALASSEEIQKIIDKIIDIHYSTVTDKQKEILNSIPVQYFDEDEKNRKRILEKLL